MDQDLRASYQLLTLLEASKERADAVVDLLPGVFMVIDIHGIVFKGNLGAARLLGCDAEDLLGKGLAGNFSSEGWAKFLQHLGNEIGPRQVELPLADGRTFSWEMASFGGVRGPMKLFSVLGRDVSDLRNAHASLITLEKDFEVTKAVQSLLLPKASEAKYPGVELAAYYRSASQAGGDWWWVDHRPDGSTRVLLADVTGHGVGSAMVTAGFAATYHSSQLLGSVGGPAIPQLFELFAATLARLCAGHYWVATSTVEISPKQDSFEWWNAGGPSIMVLRAEGDVEVMSIPGLPLGGDPFELRSRIESFKLGDRLFVYTDGIYDFKLPNGWQCSLSKVLPILSSTRGMSVCEARDAIAAGLDDLRGDAPFNDDMTFAIIDRV